MRIDNVWGKLCASGEVSYSATIAMVRELTGYERRRMCEIYLRHYDGSDEQRFFADLEQKDEVLIVYHHDRIVGFTTFQFYPYQWNGEEVIVVFSGDTIVEREHWGQQVLAFRWIEHMGEIKRRTDKKLFWFLIVKGHRTYRYLPTFAKSFYPHWSNDRADLKSLADELAREKFGTQYNPGTGVVEFTSSQGHLKGEIASPGEEEGKKEAVRYFLERNPGYQSGHELVCICELDESNLKPLARRLFVKAQHG